MSHATSRGALGRTVVMLGAVSLLTDVASDMVMPFLPTFVASLGGGAATLGLIEGVATATSSLMKFVAGAVSDVSPRKKPFVLAGYAIANVARPLLALAMAPWHVLTIRFVDRVGKGIRTAPRDVLIARETPPEHHGTAFGFHRGMDNLGAVIGPLVATALLTWYPGELRLVFAATLVPGAIAVLAVLFGVREPAAPDVASPPRAALTLAGPVPHAMRPLLVLVAVFTLANASDAFLMLHAQSLGVAERHLPLAWGALSLVRALSTTPGGLIADRLGRERTLAVGWVLYALAYLGFGLASTPWHAAVALLVYGLYYGLTEGTERGLVASRAAPAELGRAFGYFNFVTGALALPASLLFGCLYPYAHGRVAFGLCAMVAFCAALGALRWLRKPATP